MPLLPNNWPRFPRFRDIVMHVNKHVPLRDAVQPVAIETRNMWVAVDRPGDVSWLRAVEHAGRDTATAIGRAGQGLF